MHLSEIKVSTTEISGLVYLLYINHFCFTSYFSSVIHAPPAVALDPLPPPPHQFEDRWFTGGVM